ncbi:MAG: phenylalanine--tRNA ligase subunit alpha [Bacteroidia bacterium]|nr:phenylalanine--tRNA ligase subunit alpha [Bacteroidia bacterium]
MLDKINGIRNEAESEVLTSAEATENFRIKYLGRKGLLNDLFEAFKLVPGPEKRDVGKALNELKLFLEAKWQTAQENTQTSVSQTQGLDLTLPGEPYQLGSRHPLSIVRGKIAGIFERIGYTVADGPEIEDDWHNFSALNFPLNHPARDMQDTFFVENPTGDEPFVLRTHTSSVQVRVMETTQPPIRMIMPGRVYRNEAISARAHCFFHQVEGLYIDKDVSFAELKQTLLYFAQELFGKDVQIRLRPSYFPFTEPSFEVDVSCSLCGGKGCNICKYTGWLEILGCGMVDPNVLDNCGIDSKQYTGFAFGMGIERIAQLLFRVPDLRLYSENDLRFLNQFKAERS